VCVCQSEYERECECSWDAAIAISTVGSSRVVSSIPSKRRRIFFGSIRREIRSRGERQRLMGDRTWRVEPKRRDNNTLLTVCGFWYYYVALEYSVPMGVRNRYLFYKGFTRSISIQASYVPLWYFLSILLSFVRSFFCYASIAYQLWREIQSNYW
jgi:hypothetical protein